MPSFDIVSRLDLQEIDNAISNVLREITTRYDFKGSETSVERKDKDLTVVTDDELKLSQVYELIITHLVRRKVDPLTLKEKIKEKAGGDKVRQIYKLNEGIEQTIAKKITSDVKNSIHDISKDLESYQRSNKRRDDLSLFGFSIA